MSGFLIIPLRICSELGSREQTDLGLNPISGTRKPCSLEQTVNIFSLHLLCVSVRVLQRNRTNRGSLSSLSLSLSIDRYQETLIYFKELAHMIVEVSKTATCGVDCQAEDTSES